MCTRYVRDLLPYLIVLSDALYIEGMATNLFIINQIYNNHLGLRSSQGRCEVFNRIGKCILAIFRATDNYYAINLALISP